MKAELLNPFITSFNQAISMFAGDEAVKKEITALNALNHDTNLHVFLGIAGDIAGTVIFSAQKSNALKIASMMAGMDMGQIDEISSSALQELLNMTSGGASTKLAEMKIYTDITPPTLVTGSDIDIRLSFPLLSVKMEIKDIPFYLNLSVKQSAPDKILIVDSNPLMRKRTSEIIKLSKYKITGECADIKSCIKSIQTITPNIIIVGLNEHADLSTIWEIKRNYPKIKIIASTILGQSLPDKIEKIVDAQVNKPYTEESLLNCIKKINT